MRDYYTNYPRSILWLIQGGSILIGGAESNATPTFEAEVESFYLGKFPVTNKQFEAFDPAFRRSPLSPAERDPAAGVSFEEASAYCRWYAGVSRKKIRLPSEVEWEYACRAGSNSRYFFEDPEEADRYIWDRRNSQHKVQSLEAKQPNSFGLYGMLGSVWEWTASCFRPYPLPSRDAEAPAGPALRVLRGGSWQMGREEISCSLRRAEPPDIRIEEAGFRIARSFRSG
ncbi:MAG: SUMF1/EgtB/PvdO family nonheme iron enzyme [Acidobacteriota bacterium]